MQNNTNFPIVSLVIPVYNVSQFIETTIISIINQTYQNWELLLVDDGSTDNTIDIITPFLTDKRISLYNRPINEAKGAQTCRNFGMSHSKGQYICFFDGDDLLSQDCLETRVAAIEKSRFDFCIFPAADFVDDIRAAHPSKFGIPTGSDVLSSFLSANYQFTVWTNIYKKSSLSNIIWDPKVKIYQDLDFNIQCLVNGLTFEFVESKPNYFYRRNVQGSISSQHMSDEKLHSTIYLFTKILNSINDRNDVTLLRRTFLRFHTIYYNRVVNTGSKKQVKVFLAYIKKSYGQNIYKYYNFTKLIHKLLRLRAIPLLRIVENIAF